MRSRLGTERTYSSVVAVQEVSSTKERVENRAKVLKSLVISPITRDYDHVY
jgi:hypothetical protein